MLSERGRRRSAQQHTTPIRERGRASSFVDFRPRPVTSRIRRLEPATAARLRSSSCVPSVVSAVSELVLNSIDAGATAIEARIDLQGFKITVSDNGSGMLLEDLQLAGERYATSKCSDLAALEANDLTVSLEF